MYNRKVAKTPSAGLRRAFVGKLFYMQKKKPSAKTAFSF